MFSGENDTLSHDIKVFMSWNLFVLLWTIMCGYNCNWCICGLYTYRVIWTFMWYILCCYYGMVESDISTNDLAPAGSLRVQWMLFTWSLLLVWSTTLLHALCFINYILPHLCIVYDKANFFCFKPTNSPTYVDIFKYHFHVTIRRLMDIKISWLARP